MKDQVTNSVYAEINSLINVISNCIDGSPETLKTDQQYTAWIQNLEYIKHLLVREQTRKKGILIDTCEHLHEKDNYMLMVLPHDSESSIIIDSKAGGNNELFERHVERMLDIAHERMGYDHEKAPRPIKTLFNTALRKWKEQWEKTNDQ